MVIASFFYFSVFVLGLAIGSFLNSIIYRLHTGESFLFQRSYCPRCKKNLGWQDLIPLLSFLILRGKCRYCKKPIPWQYPLVELATGLLFVFIFRQDATLLLSGYTALIFLRIGFLLLASCFLIIIFISDLKYYIIPDKIIYPAIIISLIVNSLIALQQYGFSKKAIWLMANGWLAAFGAAAFFLLIVLVSRGKWMGWGDPKLVLFMGLLLGFPKIILALFLAFLIGAIMGIGLIISGKKTLKSEVPFGPFLVIGTFVALFWGGILIDWYLNLFWQI